LLLATLRCHRRSLSWVHMHGGMRWEGAVLGVVREPGLRLLLLLLGRLLRLLLLLHRLLRR
jgi:hypothetical protein